MNERTGTMGGFDIRRHGRILWAALSIILIAGIAASLLIADSARKSEESAAIAQAATVAEDDLLPLLSSTELAGPITGARYDAFLSDVQRDVLPGTASGLTIWKPDGTVLFSTERDLVGTRPDDGRDALRRAVRGGANGDVDGTLFRSWIPLRLRESGPVVAVAQLDRPYAPIWTAANRLWRLAAIAMGTGLLATVALFLLSFRGAGASHPNRKPAPKPQQPSPSGDDWPAAQEQKERKQSKKHGGSDPAYTHPGYREAVESLQQADERARVAEEQYRALEEQFKRALEELRAAEQRLKQSEGGGPAAEVPGADPRVDEILARMEALQGQLGEAEERAAHAQQRAQAAEAALQHAQASGAADGGDDTAIRAELEKAQQREREALERLAAEEQRASQMEAHLRESAERVSQTEAQLREAERRAAEAQTEGATSQRAQAEARALEAQLGEAMERATVAEERMREAEVLASQAAERAAQIEAKVAAAEQLVRTADERTAQADNAVSAAEAKAAQAEEHLILVRAQLEEQLAEVQAQAGDARAHELELADARARDAETQLAAVHARLEEATARVAELEAQATPSGPDEEHAALQEELDKTRERLKASSERLLEMEERARNSERELEQVRTQSFAGDERAAALDRALHGEGEHFIGEDRRAAAPFVEALTKDTRASVNSILGLALTAKHTRDHDDLQPLLRQLTSQARKLDHLVADILEADRLAKGTVPLNRRRTDLDALVRRVVEESGIETERDVRVHSERVSVSVDPVRVEQIVSSLLASAASRTGPGTSVYVRVERTDEGAMIAIEDDQPVPDEGISPIVSRFTDLHGGRAEVATRLDGGSSFRVYLPNPTDQEAAPAEEETNSNGQVSPNSTGPTVDLAVEDVGSKMPQE